jgi:hypothetical protein
MKIVIVKFDRQEYGLCSGKITGTAKLFSTIDNVLAEEEMIFGTTSVVSLPFGTGAYWVQIVFGMLGGKSVIVEKDREPVPLHQLVITNNSNSMIIFDEQS